MRCEELDESKPDWRAHRNTLLLVPYKPCRVLKEEGEVRTQTTTLSILKELN